MILTLGVEGAGTTEPEPGDYDLSEGEVVQIHAVPDPGWRFDHWNGDIVGTANPRIFQVNTDMTVIAVFTPKATEIPVWTIFPLVLGMLGIILTVRKGR